VEELAKTIALEVLDELLGHPGFNRWWDGVDTLSKSRMNKAMLGSVLSNLEADEERRAKEKKNSIWNEMRKSDEHED